MIDEQIELWILQYRASAEVWGETAVKAMRQGDLGGSRTAARQAAKYARIAVQLENGEIRFEPEANHHPTHQKTGEASERRATEQARKAAR